MNKLTLLAAIMLFGTLNANIVKADATHEYGATVGQNDPKSGMMHPGDVPAEGMNKHLEETHKHMEGLTEVPAETGGY